MTIRFPTVPAIQAGSDDNGVLAALKEAVELLMGQRAITTGAYVPDNGGSAWVGYSPVVGTSGGSITATSTGRFKQIGKTVFVQLEIDVATVTSGSGYVTVTLPVRAAPSLPSGCQMLSGREIAVVGNGLCGQIGFGGTTVAVLNYNNTYPAAAGYKLVLGGVYEAA